MDETIERSYFTSLKKLIYTADFTRKLQFLVRSLEKNRFIFQAKTSREKWATQNTKVA